MPNPCTLWVRLLLLCLLLTPFVALAQQDNVNGTIANALQLFQDRRYSQAEKQFNVALKMLQDKGIVDQRTATVVNGLGMVAMIKGKYAESETYLRQALSILQRLKGQAHPDVAACLNNLADLYNTVGKPDDALQIYGQSLQILETVYGAKSPDILATLANIAALQFDLDRYTEAQPLLLRTIENIDFNRLDESELVWPLTTLAVCEQKLNHPEAREAALTRVKPIAEKVYGDTAPEVMPILAGLADINYDRGNYKDAEPLLKRILTEQTKTLAPDDLALATTKYKLGLIALGAGRTIEAETYVTAVLNTRFQALGEDNVDTAAAMSAMGRIYLAQDKPVIAYQTLMRALTVQEKQLGKTHRDVGTTLAPLAWLELTTDQYPEAEEHAKRALEIKERELGRDNPELGQTVFVLGRAELALEKFTEAESHLRRALALREKAVGKDSPELLPILKNLADVLRIQDRQLEAVEFQERMRAIDEKPR